MEKTRIGPQTLLYPMPVLLIGANVNSKPNFMVCAWGGIANGQPPMISVAIRKDRYTGEGIRQNMAFSVNLPWADIVKEIDYCGLVTGSETDKVNDCNFKVFYGKLSNVPLVEQCPVNLECKVVHLLNLGTNSLVIGEIDEVHISDDCLTDGKPDPNKINPLTFIGAPERKYRALGMIVAEAYSIGNKLKGS